MLNIVRVVSGEEREVQGRDHRDQIVSTLVADLSQEPAYTDTQEDGALSLNVVGSYVSKTLNVLIKAAAP